MRRNYLVIKGEDNLYRLIGQGDKSGGTFCQNFTLEQDAGEDLQSDEHHKLEFTQKMDAALHAESLIHENVHWTFNGVELETDMQHRGDLWAIYTELAAEMAN